MRPVTRILATLIVAASVVLPAASSTHAAGDQLRLDFDEGASLATGTRVSDMSGKDNDGTVFSKYGGVIVADNGRADLPGPCSSEPCPNANIQIADDPSLNPGAEEFEWGATVRLAANETADGENVVQKGSYGAAGGQWKLQIDKAPGKPSCVVSGVSEGKSYQVVLKSSMSVADGTWHQITCRRTDAGVTVLIDGVARGFAAMPVVTLSGTASVMVGAKTVANLDNDQFQGKLDDVFMRFI